MKITIVDGILIEDMNMKVFNSVALNIYRTLGSRKNI